MTREFYSAHCGRFVRRAVFYALSAVCVAAVVSSSAASRPHRSDPAYIETESGAAVELPLDLFVGVSADDKSAGAVSVSGPRRVSVKINAARSSLNISAPADFYGFDAFVVATPDGLSRAAVVSVESSAPAVFRYKPSAPVKNVAVAGDFNSWNPASSPLAGPDSGGFYTLSLKIPAGRHNYKFVVDGQWLPDPDNPERASDGFGGHNSAIEIGSAKIAPGNWRGVSMEGDSAHLVYSAPDGSPRVDAAGIMAVSGSKILERGDDYAFDVAKGELIINTASAGGGTIMLMSRDETGAVVETYYLKNPAEDGWDGRLIYFAFTDRFFNGDASNDRSGGYPEVEPAADYRGGDFAGITAKLREGYFERLGVGALWLSPHIKNPDKPFRDALPPRRYFTGYHGYWPVSFDETDPRFGSIDELGELVAEAHKRGIKVMLDMVLNHAHEENPLYKEKPEWFSALELPDGRKNIRLFDERPLDTWFDEFLPNIDYAAAPDAAEYMAQNCIDWIKKTNCDGFRLDAVKHAHMNLWTALRRRIRRDVEIPRGEMFYLVGETISGRDKIMEYVGFDKLDGQFDFPLYWAIKDAFAWQTIGLDKLESERAKSQSRFAGAYPSALLGNHDFARFTAFADGAVPPGADEKSRSWENRPEVGNPATYQKLKMAFAFLMSEPGMPTLYYGDEIGLSGAGDPDNRRPMKFNNLSRYEKETLEYVGKLGRFRRGSKALRFGDRYLLEAGENILVWAKNYFGEVVITAVNRSPKAVAVSAALPETINPPKGFEDIISGKKTDIRKLRIPPMSAVVLKGI
jgi:glycosidase